MRCTPVSAISSSRQPYRLDHFLFTFSRFCLSRIYYIVYFDLTQIDVLDLVYSDDTKFEENIMDEPESSSLIGAEEEAMHMEKVVAWNVKMLLTARRASQFASCRGAGDQESRNVEED